MYCNVFFSLLPPSREPEFSLHAYEYFCQYAFPDSANNLKL